MTKTTKATKATKPKKSKDNAIASVKEAMMRDAYADMNRRASIAAYSALAKVRQQLCANAELSIEERQNGVEEFKIDYEPVLAGCQELRRNGSKWCQKCSDRHNKSR